MIAYLSHLTSLTVIILLITTIQSSDDKETNNIRSRALHFSEPRAVSRSQIFDIPTVAAVVIALTFLLFLLPFRILRFNATSAAGPTTRRKDPNSSASTLMEETAAMARKILDAIEKDPSCVNQTACGLGKEIKEFGKDGGEMVLRTVESLLPPKWKPTVTIMKEAVVAKQPDKFCMQFVCDEPEEPESPPEEHSTVDWVTAE